MASRKPDHRKAELAKIHIAAKQLGMSDEQYRAVLWTVARVDSAKDLDAAGRAAVLEHLKSRGFKSRGRGRSTPADDRAPLIRKVRAILAEGRRPDTYADSMAQHMFRVERFEWLTPGQLHKLVAALSIDAERRHRRARAQERF